MSHPTAFFPGDVPSAGKPSLLLVEDEHSYAVFLHELLAEEYKVEVTSNGEQAWAAVQRRLPDLILSDVQMPLLNGLDLTRRLRADPRTAGMPIVLMTASNQKEVLLAGLEAGMDEFLVKPFHPEELLARLRCQRRMIVLRKEASAQLARKEAEAVEQARYRFLSSLSHELRTPLTPVRMGLHLLGRTKGLPASARGVLAMIRRNVDTEVRLINDLLDVSQLLHGKLVLDVAPTDLHGCLGEALDEARESFAGKHLQLVVNLTAKHHRVLGDAGRLKQVFGNLPRNAEKFTSAQGGGHRPLRRRRRRHRGRSNGHRPGDHHGGFTENLPPLRARRPGARVPRQWTWSWFSRRPRHCHRSRGTAHGDQPRSQPGGNLPSLFEHDEAP